MVPLRRGRGAARAGGVAVASPAPGPGSRCQGPDRAPAAGDGTVFSQVGNPLLRVRSAGRPAGEASDAASTPGSGGRTAGRTTMTEVFEQLLTLNGAVVYAIVG